MNLLSSWTDEYSSEDSLRILSQFALRHAKMSGVHDLILLMGELDQLLDYLSSRPSSPLREDVKNILSDIVNWETTYETSRSADSYYHERQSLGFFQKLTFADIGVDREAVAYEKFLGAEAECRLTNEAFRSWRRGSFKFSPDVEAVFHRAAQNISRILGPVPQLSQLRLRFGPGATTETKRRFASARVKLGDGVACSENLFPMAQAILEEMPLLSNLAAGLPFDDKYTTALVPVRIAHGKLGFVPKNAKTFRTVVTEPVLNGMVQLGIGDLLAKRLLAFGIDTRDQSLNQRLAREGSLTGALATLDLSSASDTIATELVYHLLPLDWACLLDRCRSRTVTFKGHDICLEKLSSMGNGYTFPLETLIFWSLVRACCPLSEIVSVYGDDIICPSHRTELVRRVLRAAGFSVNVGKSFDSGPFRESCGADYFRGFDIRPFYQKNLVSPATLFVLHNFYVRTYDFEAAAMVRSFIADHLQLFGPDGFGDGHLLGDWTGIPHGRARGYSGYLFDSFTRKNLRDRRRILPGDAVLPYYSTYISCPLGQENTEIRSEILHGRVVDSSPPSTSRFVLPGSKSYKRVSIYTLARP